MSVFFFLFFLSAHEKLFPPSRSVGRSVVLNAHFFIPHFAPFSSGNFTSELSLSSSSEINEVSRQGLEGVAEGPIYEICLTSESDCDWQRLRYLPLPKALERFRHELNAPVDGEHNEDANSYDEFAAAVGGLKEDLFGYLETLRQNPQVCSFISFERDFSP